MLRRICGSIRRAQRADVLLDLVLLKLGVYRHLLYNRGAPPRRLAGATSAPIGTGAGAIGEDDDGAGATTKKKGEGNGGPGAGAVDEDAHAAAVKETVRHSLIGRLNPVHPFIHPGPLGASCSIRRHACPHRRM